jgi:glycosyltransferase involved in cell wall biosynthesis
VAHKLAQADRRVSVISHSRNQGHISTYNEGIAWASADYFLLLSADDLLVPGALERAAGVMDAAPDVVLTHGRCAVWYDDLPFPTIDLERDYTWALQDLIDEMCTTAMNVVATPTAIARTCTQKAIGGYRASLPHSGDMEMWLRFAAHGAVARIDAVQAIYRKHSSAMSSSYYGAQISSDYRQRKQTFESFFEEYGGCLRDYRTLWARSYRILAKQAFQSGIWLLRRGRLSSGLQLLRWSMDLDPRLRYCPPLWQLLKIPGPEGREWASSVVRQVAGKLLGRTWGSPSVQNTATSKSLIGAGTLAPPDRGGEESRRV